MESVSSTTTIELSIESRVFAHPIIQIDLTNRSLSFEDDHIAESTNKYSVSTTHTPAMIQNTRMLRKIGSAAAST